MAFNLTPEQEALIDPLLAAVPTPQSAFGIGPAMPATRFFQPVNESGGAYRSSGRLGSSSARGADPYGIAAKRAAYEMEAAAEQQVAQMWPELGFIDSTSPDYLQKRQQLLMQYPLAPRNPAGKQAIDAMDFNYTQSQKDPNRAWTHQLAMQGVTPDEFAQFGQAGDPNQVALGNIAYQRKLEHEAANKKEGAYHATPLERLVDSQLKQSRAFASRMVENDFTKRLNDDLERNIALLNSMQTQQVREDPRMAPTFNPQSPQAAAPVTPPTPEEAASLVAKYLHANP